MNPELLSEIFGICALIIISNIFGLLVGYSQGKIDSPECQCWNAQQEMMKNGTGLCNPLLGVFAEVGSRAAPPEEEEAVSRERFDASTIIALDTLHHASVYVACRFRMDMSRIEAQANIEARAIIFNCSNLIFRDNGCPISKEELEGSIIIEREHRQ